jgi:putative ABC transport system permease protein
MSLMLAARIARRELRGGLRGFAVFLACLTLGVGAIAGVGMVRASIQSGLTQQGAVLLGGDAQAKFTYRFATDEERAFLQSISTQISEVVDFRSMAVAGDSRVLVAVKAVDDAYPLLGAVQMDGADNLPAAFAVQGGAAGAVMDGVLADQMGLALGDRFKLGESEFRLAARLLSEPDSATSGFSIAPRVLVRRADLADSGLLGPGTLLDSLYRLTLPLGSDLEALKTQAESRFRAQGLDWDDSRRPSPSVSSFVDRMGDFLVLVGLAGLAVGGVGVAAAVRYYLEAKISTIATLRTLGATGGLIFQTYFIQVALLAGIGVGLGLALGVGLPIAFAAQIQAVLPFPADIGFAPRPVLEAGFYGMTSAFLFALWPLARSEGVRAAALYRGGVAGGKVRGVYLAALAALAALLVGGAMLLSGNWKLTLGMAGGIAVSLAILALAAQGLSWAVRRAARWPMMRGRFGLRAALAAIGAPRSETMQVVLALGLGLTVLAAVGQIDYNLRAAIARDLPTRAPSYFFVDIQQDQIAGFREKLAANPDVSQVESAPMLRGIISQINGVDAREVAGGHWVVQGDRGITYADAMPQGTTVTDGAWWPEGYDGAPQISFAQEEANEIGLKLGDMITVNILGRDITAQVTSLRDVDFSNAGMGFVMTLNAAAVAGAPHSFIATVYADEAAEAGILRDLAAAYPNITAIGIKQAIARAAEALGAIAQATTLAALATLATGFVVLIGAAASGERARVYEAAVLKVLGASRGRILASFALRAALTGAAAGLVALFAGAMGAWGVMYFIMDADYVFEPISALAVVLGGILATLAAGLVFVLRPLGRRPAGVLRSQD